MFMKQVISLAVEIPIFDQNGNSVLGPSRQNALQLLEDLQERYAESRGTIRGICLANDGLIVFYSGEPCPIGIDLIKDSIAEKHAFKAMCYSAIDDSLSLEILKALQN